MKFCTIVGFLAASLLSLFVLARVFSYIKSYKKTRKDIVNNMIAEITNSVIEHATTEEGIVVVNHLRDKLIPPTKRKELEWAWIEAIRFIEEHESRIQFEVGNRNGEDVRIMRWIDTASTSSAPGENRSVKTWQGPAFDKSNKIKDPPTPCLKIRQMFDKYDANEPNLKQIITDAILAKAGHGCRIYDIQLEKNTCCVYVRCASNADAGQVHDQINGWWFDSRLVSIKFLRLERYLARFPGSLQGPACLKPVSCVSVSSSPPPGSMQNGENNDDND